MTTQELYEQIGGTYASAKRTMMMDKMINRFVLKFLDDKSYQKLIDGKAAGDAAAMFEGAHALKGVGANLGFDSLSALASEVAEEFRPGHTPAMSPAELDAKFAEITALYDKTVAGIKQFQAEQ
ncbi:MAG: Hpt domain-containing protein [Oscillibacter sp.]|nr:Hpt domain-containing protein [Oscillibacter sp.]